MSIVDDLIENLVERNAIELNGTFTISVVNGGVSLKGLAHASLKDTGRTRKSSKPTCRWILGRSASVLIVIPLPQIK